MRAGRYGPEFGLIAVTAVVSILGFWELFFGRDAAPQPHHFLHLATALLWLAVVGVQLRFIAGRDFASHRRFGLVLLLAAPLVVATTAMLSVHSAAKGLASGHGDRLIIQNVMVTLELALFLLLAFVLKRRRALHGALLVSTSILFLGIALFFALISFVPMFRIEGPETFYRFGQVAMTGQGLCLAIGLLFFLRDRKHGWPFLMAGACFTLNEGIKWLLTSQGLIDPLTQVVGTQSRSITFVTTFLALALVLAAMVIPSARSAARRQLQ